MHRISRREAALVAAIVVLAAALRLWGLSGKSFWVDEILAIERSHNVRQAVAFCSLSHEPPLRYFLVHHLARLHPPELFTRLPSFALGVATVALVWWLARVLFSPAVGIVAAFLLAVSPWHIVQCQDARMYAVMMFFWALSLILFFRALEKPAEVLLWPALAVVHAANFYLSYLTAVVLAAEAVTLVGWLAVRKWRERGAFALRPYATGVLIFAGFFGMLVSFWFNPVVSLIERYTGARTAMVRPLVRAVRESSLVVGWPAEFDAGFLLGVLDNLLAPGIGWGVAALIGLSAGLSLCWRRNRPFVWIAVLSFFLSMVTILFTEMRHFVAPRYVFHLLLFFTIAMAVAVVAAAEAVLARFAAGARRSAAAVLLGALALTAAFRYYPILMLHVRCERQDWRTACRWLAEHAKADDVILTGPWGTHPAVLYYGNPDLTERHEIINCLTGDRTIEEIERSPGAWYIGWGHWPGELRSLIMDKMERALALPGLDGTIEVFQRKDRAKGPPEGPPPVRP